MKIISEVPANALIQHTGDLTVDGSVHENATIEVNNGRLMIHGDVHQKVKIQVKIDGALPRLKPTDDPYEVRIKGRTHDYVTIESDLNIYAKNIGRYCHLLSEEGIGADIIDDYSKLTSRKSMCVHSLGNYVVIKNKYGGIFVGDSVGDHIDIFAASVTVMMNVGNMAKIMASEVDVTIHHNIGTNATIRAEHDINIRGFCSKPDSLILEVNCDYGDITKPYKKTPIQVESRMGLFSEARNFELAQMKFSSETKLFAN